MTVQLVYMAPVLVDVDTTTGRVLSVRVDDGGASYRCSDARRRADGRKAREIAESVEWPSWKLGL